MVEYIDTFVTDGAVFCALWRDVDAAQVAPTILDHVQVLGPVQLRDRVLGWQTAQVRVGRVEK